MVQYQKPNQTKKIENFHFKQIFTYLLELPEDNQRSMQKLVREAEGNSKAFP